MGDQYYKKTGSGQAQGDNIDAEDVTNVLNTVTTSDQEVVSKVEFKSDVTIPTNSLVLGKDGARISSAARSLLFKDARNRNTLFTQYQYDDDSIDRGYQWQSDALLSQQPVCPLADTVLSDPQELAFSGAVGNTMTVAFWVNAATAGMLRIESWEGSDDTGAVLGDNFFDVTAGMLNTPIRIVIAAPPISEVGDEQFIRLSGIQLNGGLQTAGLFIGDICPFLQSDIFLLTKKELMRSGDDVSELNNDSEFGEFEGLTTVETNTTLTAIPDGAGGLGWTTRTPFERMYDFDTSTTNTDPGDGKYKFNGAKTFMNISKIGKNGIDISYIYDFMKSGDALIPVHIQDNSDFIRVELTGIPVLTSSSYYRIPITVINQGGSFTNQQNHIINYFLTAVLVSPIIVPDMTSIARSGSIQDLIENPAIQIENQMYIKKSGTWIPDTIDSDVLQNSSDVLEGAGTITAALNALRKSAAFVHGEDLTGINTSATPTALDIFDSGFDSTNSDIEDSGDGTGFTVKKIGKYKINGAFCMSASVSNLFVFQVYAGGVAIGENIDVNGVAGGKMIAFPLLAWSGLLAIGDKIEIRVNNSGDDIDTICGSIECELVSLT